MKTGGSAWVRNLTGRGAPLRKMDATPWKAYESIGFSLKAGYESLNF